MIYLEKALDNALDELKVAKKYQLFVKEYLRLLKEKGQYTCDHSIRVGLNCKEAGEKLNEDPEWLVYVGLEDPRWLCYSGLFHDIGKIGVEDDILKNQKFDEKDMEKMAMHPQIGYLMIKEDFRLTALVILKHHYYQKNQYPKIKNLKSCFDEKTLKKVDRYAKIVTIFDNDDAKSRLNNYNELDNHLNKKSMDSEMMLLISKLREFKMLK